LRKRKDSDKCELRTERRAKINDEKQMAKKVSNRRTSKASRKRRRRKIHLVDLTTALSSGLRRIVHRLEFLHSGRVPLFIVEKALISLQSSVELRENRRARLTAEIK
jgi:hypothetical protein